MLIIEKMQYLYSKYVEENFCYTELLLFTRVIIPRENNRIIISNEFYREEYYTKSFYNNRYAPGGAMSSRGMYSIGPMFSWSAMNSPSQETQI